MNSISLSGRLTKKPELKQTSTSKYVSDFTLAVNRGIKNENGEYEADFINCRCWNKTAENLCKYQNVGDFIIVNGNLRVDHYTDKEGKNRQITYVMVENIEFTPKQRVEAQKEPKTAQEKWDSGKDIELSEEELPFYN